MATLLPGFSPTRPILPSRSVGRVGENPGNEVVLVVLCILSILYYTFSIKIGFKTEDNTTPPEANSVKNLNVSFSRP